MTIRIPTSGQILALKQQNNQFKIKFQEKVAGFIAYQDNLQTSEIQNVKKAIQQNEERILKQKLAIDELSQKISTVQSRTQSKILLLSKELENFKHYYDQCYKYTIVRVNEISSKVNQFSQQIQNQVQGCNMTPLLQYIKYTHNLVTNIIKDSSLKTSDLKYYLDQQIYHLELQVGKFMDYAEQIQKNMADLKFVKYGNASLQEALKQAKNMVEDKNQVSMKDSMVGKKLVNFYESKFKQILKKINSQSVEIQMVKLLINTQSNQSQQKKQQRQKQYQQYEQKLKQLEKSIQQQKSFFEKQLTKKQKQYLECQSKLKDVQKSLEQQKALFQKQLVKKEQILKKRHERILQLEQSLHVLLQKEIAMQHQISEFKLHNLQLTKQIKRLNQKQKIKVYDSQTSQKSSKGIKQIKKQQKNAIQQKLHLLQSQYDNLYQKYKIQQEQLKKLSKSPTKESKQVQKMAVSQKFIRFQRPQGISNIRDERSKSKSKILNKNQDSKSTLNMRNSINDFNYEKIIKQNEKLSKSNMQLIRIQKQLQDQINHLLNAKTKQNKQDQEYIDQVQAEIQKNLIEIQRLQKQNLKLTRRNSELQAENNRLQIQFNAELQKYQLRAKTFKNTLIQMQRQNEALKLKNSELLKQLNQINEDSDSKQIIVTQSPKNYTRQSISPNLRRILGNSSQIQDKSLYKPKDKSRRVNSFLLNLQNAISSMGLPIPICIDIDKSGFVRERKTGSYLVDQSKSPLQLSQSQLKAAIESGLILI